MQHLLPPERPVFKIVTRAEWAGDDCPVIGEYAKHKPERIVIHHTFSPDSAQYKGAETIRAIYRYHTQVRKFSDIAYHYIISPDGSTIYECRPVDKKGAHCGGDLPAGVRRIFGNTGSVGPCLLGNYDVERPSREGLHTLAVLIADLCEKWQINTAAIFGHCEAWSSPPKTCPGKFLYQALFGEERWKIIF